MRPWETTCTILASDDAAPEQRDEYGHVIDAPAVASGLAPVVPCTLQPLSSSELTTDMNRQETWAKLFLPETAVLTGSDSVLVDGKTWAVVGPPFKRQSLRLGHLSATLRYVEG